MPRIPLASNPKHYDGDPCRKCHGTVRYISTNACVPCAKKYSTKWQKDNPELANKHSMKWHFDNSEESIAITRKWQKDNKDRNNHNNKLSRQKREAANEAVHSDDKKVS